MKNQVIELTCAKHIKIYKLNQLGLTNKEVAEALNTNVGHVYNVLKSYKEDSKKVEKANSI